MQTWVNKSFVRLVVLVFLFTIAVIPSSPAAQAAPVQQSGSCYLSISGPYKGGSTVTATVSLTCSEVMGRIGVEGTLTGAGNASNSAYCYGASTCSANLSAPLAYGTWTVTARGSYYTSAGTFSVGPISQSATFVAPQPHYWLRLQKIVCVALHDTVGYDEPRLYINGKLVWSHEHIGHENYEQSLAHLPRIQFPDPAPFSDSKLTIGFKEWDAWPGSTATFTVKPYAYATTDEAGDGEITRGMSHTRSMYLLYYTVVYEI